MIKVNHAHMDLREVVALISDVGWSECALRGANGSVSLLAALEMICAVPEESISSDVGVAANLVPEHIKTRFLGLLSILEDHFGEVCATSTVWSSKEECLASLRLLVKMLEIG